MSTTGDMPIRRSSRAAWVGGIVVGVLIALGLCGVAAWKLAGAGPLQWMSLLRSGPTRINIDQPTVVRQIQQLQRLETVSYTMDKIISGEHDNAYLPKFLVGDRLLLVVHGEVIAGLDLAQVHPGDVKVEGSKLTIHLPAPDIFVTRIDNQRTR